MINDNQPQGDREKDHIKNTDGIRDTWNKTAEKLLLGRKIVKVEYIPVDETDKMMWSYQPVSFLLDNGTWVYPQADDEGNEAGSLAVGRDLLPVLRGDK